MLFRLPATFAVASLLASGALAAPSTEVARDAFCGDFASLECCNQVVTPNDPSVSVLLGLLGIDPNSTSGNVGVTCTPAIVIDGTTTCTARLVCCSNNSFNGIIALGCN
ncbi:fungal hydrophobin-domain-containing protein [Mycena vulgaris]|nr:fungal hydrophobin-domain-containing protein [Mycena vulgaris]